MAKWGRRDHRIAAYYDDAHELVRQLYNFNEQPYQWSCHDQLAWHVSTLPVCQAQSFVIERHTTHLETNSNSSPTAATHVYRTTTATRHRTQIRPRSVRVHTIHSDIHRRTRNSHSVFLYIIRECGASSRRGWVDSSTRS